MSTQPLNIIPGPQYTSTEQYIVIDPTAPDHIHIRGGGPIDNCNAELTLGGENNNVIVYDPAGTVRINAQNAIGFAAVPLIHGPYTTEIAYLAFAADNVASAGAAAFTLGGQLNYGSFKCVIHARDTVTGDTEAFEHIITQDGAGNIDENSGTPVQSGAVALVTATTSIVATDVTLSLTNVAVSTNDVNVRVQVIALPLV